MIFDENSMKNKHTFKEYYKFDRNKMEVIAQIDSLFTALMSFTNCLPPDNDTWMSFTKCDTKTEVTNMFLARYGGATLSDFNVMENEQKERYYEKLRKTAEYCRSFGRSTR